MKLRLLFDAVTPRLPALTVVAGLAVLVMAAFMFNELIGMIVLGLSLIAVGAEVPRR